MMRRFGIPAAILALLLFIWIATPALADDGQTYFGTPVVVKSGETVRGDLVSFGGPISIERGATVDGDVVALGGPATVAGRVTGDIVSLGGPVQLESSAHVMGDVVAFGGPVQREEGARIDGEIVQGFRFRDFGLAPFRFGPALTQGMGFRNEEGASIFSFFFFLFRTAIKAAGVAVIALLLMIFIPEQTDAVKQVARDEPIASSGVGILTLLVACPLLLLLFLSICGIPIMAILLLALLVAILFGWVALGLLVGERLIGAFHEGRPLPIISAVIGSLVLTIVVSLPWLGWLLGFVGMIWGLGAVVLSRGGTRRTRYGAGPPPWQPAPATAPIPGTGAAPVPQPWPAPGAESARPPEAGMDNLQAIRGIGPIYESLLREAGIRTYEDLANTPVERLVEIITRPDLVPPSREAVQRWIEEARELAQR